MTNFHETIALIPYAPNQTLATGLVAPIMRAIGHILYVTAQIAGHAAHPERYLLTEEEVIRELDAAQSHLSGTIATIATAPVSTQCINQVGAFVLAVTAAHAEYIDWPQDERGRNLKDLADRATSLGTFLDLELAGIRNSDPGRSL